MATENGKPTSFPAFTSLPMELQLMIWKFWSDDKPIIYHYLLLTDRGRCYAALDTNTSKLINHLIGTFAGSADPEFDDGLPLNPAEFKIRFTGKVMPVISGTTFRKIKERMYRMISAQDIYRPEWGPTYACVNFDRDVFFFGSSYRLPGQLRFLFHGIGASLPRNISEEHWAHRIQQLAMWLPDQDLLGELDIRTFSQLRGLRKVFIIVGNSSERYSGIRWRVPNHLIKLDALIERFVFSSLHLQRQFKVRHPRFRRDISKAEAISAQLRSVFQEGNRNHIVVELMVDQPPTGIPPQER